MRAVQMPPTRRNEPRLVHAQLGHTGHGHGPGGSVGAGSSKLATPPEALPLASEVVAVDFSITADDERLEVEEAPGSTATEVSGTGAPTAAGGVSTRVAAAGRSWTFEDEMRFEMQRLHHKLDVMLRANTTFVRSRSPSSPSVGALPAATSSNQCGSAAAISNSNTGNNNNSGSHGGPTKALSSLKVKSIKSTATGGDGDGGGRRSRHGAEDEGQRGRSFFTDVLVSSRPLPARRSRDRPVTTFDLDVSEGRELSDVEVESTAPSVSIAPDDMTSKQVSTKTTEAGASVMERRMEAIREKENRMTDILRNHQRHKHFPFLDEVWRFIEYCDSSYGARIFNRVMPLLILSTVAFTVLQTFDSPPFGQFECAVVETSIDTFYLILLLVRFVSCPYRRAFLFDWFNLIDIASVMPLFVRAAIGFVIPRDQPFEPEHAFLLYWVPLLRLLKTMRRYEKLHLLFKAFLKTLEAAPVLLYMGSVLGLIFSLLMHLAEGKVNSQMSTLPQAFWFTCVTMFTVGYGDVIPITWEGKVITSVLLVLSSLFMAVPLGIIGHAFNSTWTERDRMLLVKKMRTRLRQWGYSASDIPTLFHCSDLNDDGHLTVSEFRFLIKKLRLGLSDERILQLFESFDSTSSGAVQDKELVHELFPAAYHEIYGLE